MANTKLNPDQIEDFDASKIISGTLNASRLPLPSTTTIGGVKRNTGSAGQYITGIDASGNLVYDTPASAETDDWIEVTESWSYNGTYTITIPTNGTTKYQKWMKIRFKQGGGYKYYVCSSLTATLLTVAVNTDYTVANTAITDIAVSFGDRPFGFPPFFNFSPTWTNVTVGNGTLNAIYSIIGGMCKGAINLKWAAAAPTSAITGQIQIACPVTPSTKLVTYTTVGAAGMIDAATALYMCETILNTTLMEVRAINAAGTYAVLAATSGTVPFTFGANDLFTVEFQYQLDS